MTSTTRNSPLLRNLLKSYTEDKLVEPTVRAALSRGDFAEFSVTIPKFDQRSWDGWFHPSEHGNWTLLQLVHYLHHYETLPKEKVTATFVMAVTFGSFFHDLIQELLLQKKVLTRKEVPLQDTVRNRRGHTDGRLSNGQLLEIKTANAYAYKKFDTLEGLKENEPGYYAQAQEYMDMACVDSMRYFVMSKESPYDMAEFIVPADEEFQYGQRRKYEKALFHYNNGLWPDFCCNPGSAKSRSCPVRSTCDRGDKDL